MSEQATEPAGETAAEKRARLRRMRILGNSDNRMKLILEGTKKEPGLSSISSSEPTSFHHSSSSNCDTTDNSPESATRIFATEQAFESQYESLRQEFEQEFIPSNRESEPFPRKVSMISTPIDYKTLQRSQENNAMVNNYLNTFRLNIEIPSMMFVIVLAVVSSVLELNIPSVFSTLQAIKYGISLFFGLQKGGILKEFVTFMFVYTAVQVLFRIVR